MKHTAPKQTSGLLTPEERKNQTQEEVVERTKLCLELHNLAQPLFMGENDTLCDVPFLMNNEEVEAIRKGAYLIDVCTTKRLLEMKAFLGKILNVA